MPSTLSCLFHSYAFSMSDSHRDAFQEIWRIFQDSHFQSEKAEYFQYEYYIMKDLLSYVLVVEQYI